MSHQVAPQLAVSKELVPVIEALRPFLPEAPLLSVRATSSSNAVYDLRFDGHDPLMVKLAHHPELVRGFRPERAAARLLRENGILAPDHLPVFAEDEDASFLAYRRLPGPTLAAVWPSLGARQREDALRSLGRLMRRIHAIGLPGHGSLPAALEDGHAASNFLVEDLAERLRPSVWCDWPDALPIVDRLIDAVEAFAPRLDSCRAVLNHGDLFAANILCESDGDRVACIGVIDLEDALAAPAESELARTEILHGPLFGNAFPEGWFDRVLAGYGAGSDAELRALFRAYHLMNMAFHGAITGNADYAGYVAADVDRNLASIGFRDRMVA